MLQTVTFGPSKIDINTQKNNKPHFQANNILIYNDDFLKIKSIPKSSVDLIIG